MSEMIRFKNKEEFDAHFKAMADESGDEFNDNLCIEGNHDVTLGWLRNIAEKVGYENITVSSDLEYTDTVCIDVSKNPQAYFEYWGSEISYCNGEISIWWD